MPSYMEKTGCKTDLKNLGENLECCPFFHTAGVMGGYSHYFLKFLYYSRLCFL